MRAHTFGFLPKKATGEGPQEILGWPQSTPTSHCAFQNKISLNRLRVASYPGGERTHSVRFQLC